MCTYIRRRIRGSWYPTSTWRRTAGRRRFATPTVQAPFASPTANPSRGGEMAASSSGPEGRHPDPWPSLPLEEWKDTYATLHRWTQIVGKIRLAQSPWINHSWHVTLYVTARGLTTSPIPHETRMFQVDFDFIAHRVEVRSSDGGTAGLPLEPQSVADFYRRLMEELAKLDLRVDIHKRPNEVPDAVRFDRDEARRAYDREFANRFWRVLVQSD